MTRTRTVLATVAVALLLGATGGTGIIAASSGTAVNAGGTAADAGENAVAAQEDNETTTAGAAETTAVGQETTTAFADTNTVALTFDNQTSNGTAVTVSQAVLPDGGFVAVYLAENVSGNFTTLVGPENLGQRVGNSTYLGAELNENVTIQLDRPLDESQMLIAVPHRDTNGNQQFDPALGPAGMTTTAAGAETTTVTGGEAMTTTAVQQVDAPYTQTPGDQPITATAFITVEGGAATGETTAENETTTGMA